MEKRLFLAINLPTKIKNTLHKKQSNIKKQFPENVVKWVSKDNLHITLAFLGATREDNLPGLKQELEQITFETFAIQINELTYIPNRREAKMIWAKGQSKGLQRLKESVDQKLINSNHINYSPDHNNYTPHITLGRMRSFKFKQLARERIPLIESSVNTQFKSNTFALMESKLKQEGPEYHKLKNIQG